MRPVLRTTDLALVESTRFALESEEIPAVTSNTHAAGLPFNLVTVAVLRDADFERAVALVGELHGVTGPALDARPQPRRRSPVFAITLLVLMALVGMVLIV
jgi:hypothetical protein